MRKFSYLILLLIGATVNAKPISPQEAEAVASEFFRTSVSRVSVATVKMQKSKRSQTANPYYVFNSAEHHGFVIVAGDDRSPRLLGYSDKGTFDSSNLPPQLKEMLDTYYVDCEAMLDGRGVHQSWLSDVHPAKIAAKSVLLPTAEWGQDYPYNTECPTVEDKKSPTGCVATAMAIMMKYNNWPSGYDWDAMPMNRPENPIPSLSKLMADAGKAVYMQYGAEESGAMMPWVGNKLYSEFNYSPECQFLYSKQFKEEQWNGMIKNSLDNGQPVIYSGSGSGSHAFIIDGYNADYYHVNWGWDGECNGYFALGTLQPSETADFSLDTGMVINIIPDKSGVDYSECFIDYNLWSGGDVTDPINISVVNVVKGEPFHIIQGAVTIPEYFNGEVGVALVGADDKIKEILTSMYFETYEEPVGQRFRFMDVTVTNDINPTDRIQFVAKNNKDGVFKLMRGTIISPSYVGVYNNTPRYGKVKFNIGKGVNFNCNTGSINDTELGTIPEGTKEVNLLRGLDLMFTTSTVNPNPMKSIVLTATGKLIYGDIIMGGEMINYYFNITDEHEVNVKAVDLKDVSFHLTEAGTLKDKISASEANGIRDLTLSGKVNFNDLKFIRNNMPCVRNFDMKDATIEACEQAYDEMWGSTRDYNADEMPAFGLVNLHNAYISNFILPDNLKSIGNDAMVNFMMDRITIPAGVTSIGLNAFYGNHELMAMELLNPEPVSINDCVFVDTRCLTPEGKLYVPKGSASKFRNTPVWRDFGEIIEAAMPAGVDDIETCDPTTPCDVYGIDGTLMLLNSMKSDFDQLAPGIYVVKQGKKTYKLAISK